MTKVRIALNLLDSRDSQASRGAVALTPKHLQKLRGATDTAAYKLTSLSRASASPLSQQLELALREQPRGRPCQSRGLARIRILFFHVDIVDCIAARPLSPMRVAHA
jgi:hypothetical protein